MRYRVCFAVLLFLMCGHAAWSLKFSLRQKAGTRVLFLYDCHYLQDPKTCKEYENGFSGEDASYAGDADTFRRILQSTQVDEIWLLSGGGDLEEAIKMGQTLRAARIPVQVPKGFFCVSACTVMFMGGIIRTIDPEATYEVHSASSSANEVDPKTHIIKSKIIAIATNPEEKLREFAQHEQKTARFLAMAMLRLFQNTLLIPTGKPPMDEDLDEMDRKAARDLPLLEYTQPNDQERPSDVKRIRAEGKAAVQDILMRLEREQMAAAIHELEQRSDLGPRSDAALEMLRMMYMESIRETSTLSQSELQRRG